MSYDSTSLIEQIRKRSEQDPLVLTEADLAGVLPPEAASEVVEYFTRMLVPESYEASGIYIVGRDDLADAMQECPTELIASFGFIVVATSIGGNAVVVEARTGDVFWADHDSFNDVTDTISCPPPLHERKTGDWTYVKGYSLENILRALGRFDMKIAAFLSKCLDGAMEEFLDSID